MREQDPAPPPEVQEFYAAFPEEDRLGIDRFQLEFARTKEMLERFLPPPPARVVDVGGAGGTYSLWLAERGYETHLVDASPRLVEVARARSAAAKAPIATLSVADARKLPQEDAAADAVLVMGPLYHLTDAADRVACLREAHRVLAPGGTIVAAAICRYASTLDGLARGLTSDPAFTKIRDRDLREGQHRNETGNPVYFTTAYFHRPDDLRYELMAAGFGARVLGVEGPGWITPDFDARWSDPAQREDMLAVARALEDEPSALALSAHLLGIGRRAR